MRIDWWPSRSMAIESSTYAIVARILPSMLELSDTWLNVWLCFFSCQAFSRRQTQLKRMLRRLAYVWSWFIDFSGILYKQILFSPYIYLTKKNQNLTQSNSCLVSSDPFEVRFTWLTFQEETEEETNKQNFKAATQNPMIGIITI